MFAIRTVNQVGVTVGHLLREISRATKFLLDHGAKISLRLFSTHYRRSLLVQGGLEIPCHKTTKLPGTIRNHMIMDRYEEIVEEPYCEPKDEEALGTFLIKVPEPTTNANPIPLSMSKNKKKVTQGNFQSRHIREMFRGREHRRKDEVIEID